MASNREKQNLNIEDKPPIFKSWKIWYILELVNLLAFILFAYILTKMFN